MSAKLFTKSNVLLSENQWYVHCGDIGCPTIPYADYREHCIREHGNQDEWCRKERTCKSLGAKKPLENIDGVNGKISRLKDEKEALSSKRSNATDDREK